MPTSTSDPRGHRELVNAHTVASEHVPASGWTADATVRVLSANPLSGAFSGLLRLPKGFRRPAGWFGADTEWLVLSGWLWVSRELRSYGTYDWAPAGSDQEELFVLEDMEILFMPRTGAPEYGRSKYMRRDPQTGAMSAVIWMPPGARHPKIEFHDTVEEMFQIVGDTMPRNSGRMGRGGYFWRPPSITHGPFSSEQGGIMYLYTDGKLGNYFTDDPEQPLAANVAQAQRERAASQHG